MLYLRTAPTPAILFTTISYCATAVDLVVRGRSKVSATDAKFEHEYLVKFKTMSYVHVQWLTAQEIGKGCVRKTLIT